MAARKVRLTPLTIKEAQEVAELVDEVERLRKFRPLVGDVMVYAVEGAKTPGDPLGQRGFYFTLPAINVMRRLDNAIALAIDRLRILGVAPAEEPKGGN
jgi:hypothetical protein